MPITLSDLLPNRSPRISVNKLAEYIEASVTRRRAIIKEAKEPAKFIVIRYSDAREIMKGYFQNGREEDYILEAIEELEKRPKPTEFQQQDITLSIESLRLFLQIDTNAFDDLTFTSFNDTNKLMSISGVNVSINPDLVIGKTVGEVTHKGLGKLHLSKSNVLSSESQKLVAVLLYDYATKNMQEEGLLVTPSLCFSIDAFNKSVECCPKAFKARMKTIEAACEEIAAVWDKI